MKTFYRLFTFCFLTLITQAGFAQAPNQLSGSLKDQKGAAIGFGTVAVLQADNAAVITGGVTDDQGNFQIKTPAAGRYFLRISAIGFTTFDTPPFEINQTNLGKNFGVIALKEDAKTLAEVKLQALRPTVVNHADKMVVSVEGTALAAGSTAYDVLTKSPGVYVDQDGNIQLNGKAGVRIMVDGKLTYLSGKELQTMLQGTSAENLKDLEIITNPSAKYDAEGSSGIININLKKNNIAGINGSIYGGYQYNGLPGFSGGGNINQKQGKWSSFANLDISRNNRLRTNTMLRAFNQNGQMTTYDQAGREEGIRRIPSLRLGTDYDLNSNHSIGVMANILYVNSTNDFQTTSYLRNGDAQQDVLIKAQNLINGQFANGSFNFHYLGKLDSTGTTLSADLDYVKLTDTGNFKFYNAYTWLNRNKPDSLSILGSDNPSSFNIYSAKVDYTKPFNKKTKLEAGAKISHVVSDNDLQFFSLVDNTKVPDPLRSSHFLYKEDIYAAYTNFSTSLGSKWSLQGGLRAEQTIGEGKSLSSNTAPNSRRYLNLFPSLFVLHKIHKDYDMAYNFSRRISRPDYESLNPFIFYLDPYTWAQGNPQLKPQYTNSFELKQTYKSNYILTLGYALTKDFMAEIPEQDVEAKTTVFQGRNVDQFKNYSASLIAPIKISTKWDISNNLSLAYQDYTIRIQDQDLRNEQLFFYAQSTSNVQLPKNIRLELNAVYQGPLAEGLYKIEGNWGIDAGLKRSFMNDKIDLSLNVTDIFRTRRIIGTANFNGNRNEFDQYFAQQSLRLNLRYRFNKGKQFEMKNRNTNLEELNRAGGN